ncbi:MULTISPECIES: IS200/IS605 family accessory protein TnpB-related protein [Nostocales]|uniref:IS200/IS605 family element transposase accessory protein TnpB n=3 Tax=Nostocales TaxID=1161 RepID=A0A0C1QV65_9CYAN|nr:IS200/IS605 family accessory protein TnpB-related protein [Tolypothrix bouteillei]KAF3884805.1 IS200/IS605 family element transposase accessory protein TnpB [Tolypothrix bouteillei VB521301]
MATKTYTTLAPQELWKYLEAYSKLQNVIREDLKNRLLSGDKAASLVKEFQPKYHINKRQINSIRIEVEGAIASAKECKERHTKILEAQIKSAKEYVKSQEKRVADYRKAKNSKKSKSSHLKDACSLRSKQHGCSTLLQDAKFGIHQKKRRIHLLENKLKHVKDSPLIVRIGGNTNNFTLIGSKDETNGNQISQLSSEGLLKIRVPTALEARFGKYVIASGVNFPYGQEDINYAISNSAVSFRFYYKKQRWYIAVSVNVQDVPIQSRNRWQSGCIGVDLNPSVIGWTYVDAYGNLKDKGQFQLNLHSKTTTQIETILSDVAAQLVLIAESFEVPLVLENLDFCAKKNQLREKGKRYARMLSGFAYAKWQEIIERRCATRGVELIKVNPAYSSLIGIAKFMRQHGLSSDTAAAMALARRAMFFSERVPLRTAYLNSADRRYDGLLDARKHVWAHWNILSQKLKQLCLRRHEFYQTGINSPLVVMLSNLVPTEFDSKPKGTSRTRRKS